VFATSVVRLPLPRAALAALALALCVLTLAPGRADAAPTATIAVSPATPLTGQVATFTATATADVGQTITNYAWAVDGAPGPSGATTTSITHTFTTAGSHTVTVTVTESTGSVPAVDTTSGPISQTVTVNAPNAPPTARFTWTPRFPVAGASVSFTSTSTDSDGTIARYSWDLNGDGIFGDATTPTATAAATGQTVALQVTDDLGATSTFSRTIALDKPPVAVITVAPANPLVGQTVTFSSTKSTDPDPGDSIVSSEWDLTGDGQFTDATGATAQKVFTAPGDAIVRLRVTDSRGASSVAAITVPISGPPVASFDVSASPTAGHPVTFTSTSRVQGGAVLSQQWDLDGNGLFNDAAGPTASFTYANPGTYTVSLRVTDTSGRTDIAFHSITVRAEPALAGSPAPLGAATPARPAQFLLPFPVVRIAGRVSGRFTHISLLEVRAPSRSRIRVKCAGGGCPKTDLTAVARGRPTRFKKMRRSLRAGAVIQVFIRANGRIGKYTQFRIRRARPPLRRDMCLPPTIRGPAPCTG
jgi:PKD repeat protein